MAPERTPGRTVDAEPGPRTPAGRPHRRRGRSSRQWGLLRDETGGPAIEFALVAPIVLLLLGGFVEFGLYGLTSVLLEGGLHDAARYGITGQTPTDGDRAAFMLRMIGRATGGLVDTSAIVLTIRAYPSFQDVGQGEDFVDANGNGTYDNGETFKDCNDNGTRDADRGTEGTGGSGQVVVYQLDYDWRMWTALLAAVIGKDGMLHIQASAVVRNEPWDPDAAAGESCTL